MTKNTPASSPANFAMQAEVLLLTDVDVFLGMSPGTETSVCLQVSGVEENMLLFPHKVK